MLYKIAFLSTILWLPACTGTSNGGEEQIRGYLSEASSLRTHVNEIFSFDGSLTISSPDSRITLIEGSSRTNYRPLTCIGDHGKHLKQNDKIVLIYISCSDGRHGTVYLSLDSSSDLSGTGMFTLSDGSGGALLFGADLQRNEAE